MTTDIWTFFYQALLLLEETPPSSEEGDEGCMVAPESGLVLGSNVPIDYPDGKELAAKLITAP
jgi:hypothetical protein